MSSRFPLFRFPYIPTAALGRGTYLYVLLPSQLGQQLPPLLVKGGIPFQGLANLFVCWLLILVLTNVRQVHVVDFFPLYRFTRIQNDTLASVRNRHRPCQSLFCPRVLKRQKLKFFIYFSLSNIYNMFQHSALIT